MYFCSLPITMRRQDRNVESKNGRNSSVQYDQVQVPGIRFIRKITEFAPTKLLFTFCIAYRFLLDLYETTIQEFKFMSVNEIQWERLLCGWFL